ncbi:Asparagine synthetase [glutamine-hydrolyzing], partial [hydrothermal vent metagenome]
MCGITGFIDLSRQTGGDELKETVERMAGTLQHRGPDGAGSWVDAETGLALAHRRLSIVDLSPMGSQPMLSADERYVITYNGEIYNFKSLSRELENLGHKFRGHSDTEVALAAISQWGPEGAVKRFIGMFAFALWDRKEHILYLFRDRIGKKPLYYSRFNNIFMFGSELKSLTAHPKFDKNLNRDALTLFLRHNYIPETHSIYKNVYKLAPGHFLALNLRDKYVAPEPTAYWSAFDAMTTGTSNPFTGPDNEAINELDLLLRDAVKIRMEADVPLGAFLSGGIDSSLVVALMQAQSARPVKTFSIGFHEEEYNEAQYAKKVAQHFGTEHTELYIKPEEALAVIPNLPELYDEPFADVSQIPTFLVSKLARQHVTVSLSGDGGDEL